MNKLSFYDLKQAIRTKYAWPGGYELAGVTSDGVLLCCDCMKTEFRQVAWSIINNVNDGWRVVRLTASCEMEGLNQCDHCNHTIHYDED